MSIVKFETAHRFNLDIFLMDMNCQVILVSDAIAVCPTVISYIFHSSGIVTFYLQGKKNYCITLPLTKGSIMLHVFKKPF